MTRSKAVRQQYFTAEKAGVILPKRSAKKTSRIMFYRRYRAKSVERRFAVDMIKRRGCAYAKLPKAFYSDPVGTTGLAIAF